MFDFESSKQHSLEILILLLSRRFIQISFKSHFSTSMVENAITKFVHRVEFCASFPPYIYKEAHYNIFLYQAKETPFSSTPIFLLPYIPRLLRITRNLFLG